MVEPVKLTTREEQARRLSEAMRRQLGEFCGLLDEPDVVEISLNPDGRVWVDRLGQPMQPVGAMRSETAESFIGTIGERLPHDRYPRKPDPRMRTAARRLALRGVDPAGCPGAGVQHPAESFGAFHAGAV